MCGDNKDMEKQVHRGKSLIQEIHLYPNKIEALIKDSIWIISWIGGILILQDVADKRALGGSYFIFSLSLLMEFVPQIRGKSYFRSRFLHTLFCSSILIMMFMAVSLLVGIKGSNRHFNIMFGLSVAVMGYIALNFIILWLGKEDESENISVNTVNSSDDLSIQKIQESLDSGKLGHI